MDCSSIVPFAVRFVVAKKIVAKPFDLHLEKFALHEPQGEVFSEFRGNFDATILSFARRWFFRMAAGTKKPIGQQEKVEVAISIDVD